MMRKCKRCGTSIEGSHYNRIYCEDCAPIVIDEERKKRYRTNKMREKRKTIKLHNGLEYRSDAMGQEVAGKNIYTIKKRKKVGKKD